jgi:hypothetical protein
VNFLFHFELASHDSGRDRVGVGAMLPDFWRMVARPARARRNVSAELAGDDEALRDLLEGANHHLAADVWFHKSPFFSEGDSEASAALARTGSKRIGLFGHIVWEMCLDGALLRLVGRDRLAARIAAAIAASRAAAAKAADIHHGDARERAGVEPGVFQTRMDRLLDAVASFALPDGYMHAEGVALRTRGVRAAFGLPEPTPDELERWQDAIRSLEPAADRAALGITSRRPSLCSAP